MGDSVILHSDLNSFYASVEMMLDPSLRGKAVAVCGSTEDRHGIVLAKSDLAKKAGIKTGMVNWEARQLCKDLIVVPPHYDQYLKYSKLTQAIYQRYTDLIEPFGMDECWLDVTGSNLYGSGKEIAEKIRKSCREELGLTVSIGVSYNKIFAKLGSDMKKPDAITEISRETFKEKVWPLDCSEMIYCGRATSAKLAKYGIHTIVQPWEFAIVQAEIKRRRSLPRRYSGQSVLATHIICGDCGDYYGSKTWHSTSKYRRTIWQCNSKFSGGQKCKTPHLDEEQVKSAFIAAFNTLIENRDALIEDGIIIQRTLTDCTEIDSQIAAALEEQEVVTELIRKCIAQNATDALDQEDYAKRYTALMDRFEAIAEKLAELNERKQARDDQACMIGGFLFELKERDEALTEFDPYIWAITLDVVTAYSDGRLVFKFRNGLEIEA